MSVPAEDRPDPQDEQGYSEDEFEAEDGADPPNQLDQSAQLGNQLDQSAQLGNPGLSILSFIKTDQTHAPTSPRTLDVIAAQGLEVDDLVMTPYEELTASSDVERKMRHTANEKRRKAYVREVARAYKQTVAAEQKRPRSLPDLDSIRSQVSTDRKHRVDNVLHREKKALVQHEKLLSNTMHRSLTEQSKAKMVEDKYRSKLKRIESINKRKEDRRQAEAVCKSVWRRSKIEKAQELAARDLERHANSVLAKDRARMQAFENKERQQAAAAEQRRLAQERKAEQIASSQQEGEAQKMEMLRQREIHDSMRQKAYEDAMKRHQIEAKLRGHQKDITTEMKRDKVRRMEREMVEHHRLSTVAKEAAYERRQNMEHARKQELMLKNQSREERYAQRQQEMLHRAEARKEELECKLAAVEASSTRALERREEEMKVKALKQKLRNEELERAHAKLEKMEAYKQQKLLDKLHIDEQKTLLMHQERQREADLLKNLKRQTALIQKRLKDEASAKYKANKAIVQDAPAE